MQKKKENLLNTILEMRAVMRNKDIIWSGLIAFLPKTRSFGAKGYGTKIPITGGKVVSRSIRTPMPKRHVPSPGIDHIVQYIVV